jgi:hypothetical protein
MFKRAAAASHLDMYVADCLLHLVVARLLSHFPSTLCLMPRMLNLHQRLQVCGGVLLAAHDSWLSH